MKTMISIALAILFCVAVAAFVFLHRGEMPVAEPSPAASIPANPSLFSPPPELPSSPAKTAPAPLARVRPPVKTQTLVSTHPAVVAPQPTRSAPDAAPHSAAASAAALASNRPAAQPYTWAVPGKPLAAVEFIVPRGAVLPAALVDSAEGASPAQNAALDTLANEFLNELAADDAPKPPTVVPLKKPPARAGQPDRWDAATRMADERYRQLFGVEAYNAWTAAAAKEALADK